MEKPKAGLYTIWSAIIIACGLYQAQAQPIRGNEKMKTPLKITWEIYSGRVSPYFEIKSMKELHEIEARLRDLPLATGGAEQSEWSGAYIFVLRDQQKNGTRLVSVCRSEIHIQDGKQKYIYSDTKSLRKYLDELKGGHKLISGDGLPVHYLNSNVGAR
jgi:hypothetical protein